MPYYPTPESMQRKVHENRLRRMAHRQGLRVVKPATSRDPRALNSQPRWELRRGSKRVAGPFNSLAELDDALAYDLGNPPPWVTGASGTTNSEGVQHE